MPVATIFNVQQSFNDGTTDTPVYTAKQQDNGIQGTISAGPMPDATIHVDCLILLDRQDGNGFVAVGGLSGDGGMTSTTRGGPLDTPVTISANTFCALQQGWKVKGRVTVTGAPVGGVPVSFAG